MKQLVKVVVPLYKEELNEWESMALENNMRVLAAHPVVFLKPEGLDTSRITGRYPQAETREVSTDWLGTKRGISGYNDMMTSAAFYDMFPDVEYVLICHTDAWVFRDEVRAWCEKGYDLMAAPWPMRPRYTRFPLRLLLLLKQRRAEARGVISRTLMYGKVGNGGLCLRRVSAFRQACVRHVDEIARFNSLSGPMYNEDIFWALVPKELHLPDVSTALPFAFDLKPRLCYKLNGKKLPMGCHGFMHESRKGFWKDFIPAIKA